MRKSFLFLVLILLAGGLLTADAQQIYITPAPKLDVPNMIWNSHLLRQMGTNATGQSTLAEQLKQNALKKNNKTNGNAANTKSPILSYRKEFAFDSKGNFLLPQKILESQGANKQPLNAEQINSMIGYLWTQYQASFSDENQRLKMPYQDVGTAMTYYIIYNYLVANDLSSLESEKSVAVYNQLANVFLSNPDFVKLADSDKQLLAEVLITVGGMPHIISKTQNDAVKVKEAARANLVRLLGQNTARLKITENGIEF